MFFCKRCGNHDSQYIGYFYGEPYCRKCLSFPKKTISYAARSPTENNLQLSYALTEEQKKIADALLERYFSKRNAFVHAVCGAGKTEIVYPLIDQALRDGKRVGFAIPRREVVVELSHRLEGVFPTRRIAVVYGGHTAMKEGDIVVLTMHQLYAYEGYFDVLIGDEVDAFPFHGNAVLQHFFIRASRDMLVMMSATPTEEMLSKIPSEDHLFLFRRFHGQAIPVPKMIIKNKARQILFLLQKLRKYQKEKKPCFIFAPTIRQAEHLFSFLRFFFSNGACVHSKQIHRTSILKQFKRKEWMYLVTTSILERGITIAHLQVIIYQADSPLYYAHTLEQISGRVGRKKEAPQGDVFFIAQQETRAMIDTIARIRKYNHDL